MAIAHVCLSCGHDLAGVEPEPDPHYALPLVWCPLCARPSCRRPHPVAKWWRTMRAAGWAGAWLLVKLLAGTLLVAASFGAVHALWHSLPATGSVDPWAVSFAGAVAVCHGIWITAALGHLRLLVAWIGWAATIYAVLGVAVLIDLVMSTNAAPPTLTDDALDYAVGLGVPLAAAFVGMPFGMAFAHLRDAVRRERRAGAVT